jgi:hypothetical protein
MLKHPFAFTVLLFFISFGVYVFVQQSGGLFQGDANTFFRWAVPGQFHPAGSTSTVIGPGSAPESPYAHELRIASVAPGGGGVPGRVLVVNLEATSFNLENWSVAGSLGSQRIGSEGKSAGHQLSLELMASIFASPHDTARLYDADGRLVDQFSF